MTKIVVDHAAENAVAWMTLNNTFTPLGTTTKGYLTGFLYQIGKYLHPVTHQIEEWFTDIALNGSALGGERTFTKDQFEWINIQQKGTEGMPPITSAELAKLRGKFHKRFRMYHPNRIVTLWLTSPDLWIGVDTNDEILNQFTFNLNHDIKVTVNPHKPNPTVFKFGDVTDVTIRAKHPAIAYHFHHEDPPG